MNYARLSEIAAWAAALVMGYIGGAEWFADNPDVVTGIGGVISSVVMTFGILAVKGFQSWIAQTGASWLGTVINEAIFFAEDLLGPGTGASKKAKALERIDMWFKATDLKLPWFVPEVVVRRAVLAMAEPMIDTIVAYFNERDILPSTAK